LKQWKKNQGDMSRWRLEEYPLSFLSIYLSFPIISTSINPTDKAQRGQMMTTTLVKQGHINTHLYTEESFNHKVFFFLCDHFRILRYVYQQFYFSLTKKIEIYLCKIINYRILPTFCFILATINYHDRCKAL
jgi:hypothetical protein